MVLLLWSRPMIELGYDSAPDEFGIHDGRQLARQLIADAYGY